MENKELQILSLENRINRLTNSGKNIKCPGVLKKLRRKLKNLLGA